MDDHIEHGENRFQEIEEIEDEVDKSFKKFKNFRVLQYPPSDHHFKYRNRKAYGWYTKMKKEWGLLEANLPSSIFLTTYESRMDLMRACIVGFEGTPYCYGLFFFDIMFPTDYPTKPPEIFYHSNGFDLNPNLHEDGRVSLNLLNSHHWYKWRGKEKSWNPEQSDILQVLVTIQNLILNDKPYVNESLLSYFNKDRSSKNANSVFMASCEAMLYTLKFLPMINFDVFVLGHFRNRAHCILLIYKDQMRRHGNNNKDMKQLFFRLVRAFEANGTYCRHHCNKAEADELDKEDYCLQKTVQYYEEGNRSDFMDNLSGNFGRFNRMSRISFPIDYYDNNSY